jgi:hypothetical protein
LDKKEELNHLQEKVMPKSLSRNPRAVKTRSKDTLDFVEVGPPMTFEQAMDYVRGFNAFKEDADFRDDTTTNFIESKQLNYHLGMVVLCIACDDLKKAMWYLNREIENRSKK